MSTVFSSSEVSLSAELKPSFPEDSNGSPLQNLEKIRDRGWGGDYEGEGEIILEIH